MSGLFGKQHQELVQQLVDWWHAGPPVGLLEGFPGVGKSNAVMPELRHRLSDAGVAVAEVEALLSGGSQVDDLLLDLAQEFSFAGIDGLVGAIDAGSGQQGILVALQQAMRQRLLVVIDEAQHLLAAESGEPVPAVRGLLDRLARHADWPGRLLLVTNRMPRRGRWSDPHEFFTLRPLAAEDGVAFLGYLLAASGREAEIPPHRRADVVAWVGGNPRALKLIVAALASTPLDDLIGIEPELWELRDREVARSLLENLERELLRKVIVQLPPAVNDALLLGSVYRKAVTREAWDAMPGGAPAGEAARREMVDRFLLEHQRGWFTLNPVAREVARAAVSADDSLRRRAHSLAGDHYARHFRARELKGGGRLGGHYVEARYHLVQAGREGELVGIANRYLAHLRAEISHTSQIPRDAGELNERIAVLSAALEGGGPKGLEYYLARCLARRGRDTDGERALDHARRAVGAEAPVDAWNLLIRLEGEITGAKAAVETLRNAERFVDPSKNLEALYRATEKTLVREGELDEAVALVRRGINKIPPEYNLFALYQTASERLVRQGKFDTAVELLKEGIDKIPPEYSLVSLYQAAAEILARQGKLDYAVELLERGIDKIPSEQNVFYLYQTAGATLASQGKLDAAIDLLCEGLRDVPERFNRHRIAESAVLLAAASGRLDLLEQVAAIASGPQRAMAAAFRKLHDDDCASAVLALSETRRQFPQYVAAAFLQALSSLGAGEPFSARQQLPDASDVRYEKGFARTWAATFVALRCGDEREAHQLFAAFTGQRVEECSPPTERTLLAAWNGPVEFMASHPSYYFPILPSALTGLRRPIVRPPTREPVAELTALLAQSPASKAGPAFLAVATEWSSHRGGLSTLNRELCRALAHTGIAVTCWVPRATADEIAAAEAAGVLLLAAPRLPAADDVSTLGQRPPLPADRDPDFVIGHGRITGPAAVTLAASFFPRAGRLHFVHMAPGEIEWLKQRDGASLRAEQREQQELDLAMGARLAVAIGPRLSRELGNLLASRPAAPPLHRLDPGLVPGELRRPPPGIQILLLGRAEDIELKGIDIAAAAIAQLPPAAFESEPVLIIRGAPPGTGDELRRQLLALAPMPGDRLRIREYTADAEDLVEDLRRSSLLLLPSRSEGFGLVGLEALAAGIPILVSDRSGIGELLREHVSQHEVPQWVVRTTGHREDDAAEWSRAIAFTLQDRRASFERAHALGLRLAAELDWAKSVHALLDALEIEFPRS